MLIWGEVRLFTLVDEWEISTMEISEDMTREESGQESNGLSHGSCIPLPHPPEVIVPRILGFFP